MTPSLRQVVAFTFGAAALAMLYIQQLLPRTFRSAPDFDEHIFLDVGHSIATTGLPTRHHALTEPMSFLDHTPLLVYVVGLVDALGGDALFIGRVASAAFGLATVFLIYAMIRGLPGFAAAAAVILSPMFTNWAWFLRMEVPVAFCIAAAIVLLTSERVLAAGVAVMIAVMLKEVALGFLLVMALYVWRAHGARVVVSFAAPSFLAVGAWFTYAAWLDLPTLRWAAARWVGAATGGLEAMRFEGPVSAWLVHVLRAAPVIVLMIAALAVARRRAPPIALALTAYVGIAVLVSCAMAQKELRWLIPVAPAAAMAAGMFLASRRYAKPSVEITDVRTTAQPQDAYRPG